MYLLLHIQVKCEQLLLEHLQGLQCTCMIHKLKLTQFERTTCLCFITMSFFFVLTYCYVFLEQLWQV